MINNDCCGHWWLIAVHDCYNRWWLMIVNDLLLTLMIIVTAYAYWCWLLLSMVIDIDDCYSWLMLMIIDCWWLFDCWWITNNNCSWYCYSWLMLMILSVNDLSLENSVANHVPTGGSERLWTNWSCCRGVQGAQPVHRSIAGPGGGGCEEIAPCWSVMVSG